MTLAATAASVLQQTGQAREALRALKVQLHETPVLRPGVDFRNGHLYVMVPIEQDQEQQVGRGKQAKTVTKRVTATLAVRGPGPDHDRPTFFMYDEDSVKAEGFRFPETFLQERVSRWPLEHAIRYLEGEQDPVTPSELFTKLRNVCLEYLEYPEDIYYDIVPLFVLSSYLFRLFPATGYLHFNGTRESGKSQNLRFLSAFGFNTVWGSNISTAALFRRVAGNPGLTCVDEAESFEGDRGYELKQLLLAGYVDGSVAERVEKNSQDRFITIQYDVYCPKALASINPLEPTLGSRCLVIPMQRAIRTIPTLDRDDPRWADIRSEIYIWALEQASAIADLREQWREDRTTRAPELKSRAWEIAQPLLVIGDHVGGAELVERLVPFFNTYFAQANAAREDTDLQYLLLKCLPRVMAEKHPHPPGPYYSITDMHGVVSSYIDEESRKFYSTRKVGRHLVTLGLREKRSAKGGTQYLLDEDAVRRAFARLHVIPFEEDEDWLAGRRSYAEDMPRAVAAAPVDKTLDWITELLDEEPE